MKWYEGYTKEIRESNYRASNWQVQQAKRDITKKLGTLKANPTACEGCGNPAKERFFYKGFYKDTLKDFVHLCKPCASKLRLVAKTGVWFEGHYKDSVHKAFNDGLRVKEISDMHGTSITSVACSLANDGLI